MNVCVWTDSDRFAGTEKHCLELAIGLRESGAGVVLGCRRESPLHARALEVGLMVECLDASRSPLRCIGEVQRFLRSGYVDVVHTHNGVTTGLAAAAWRGVQRGAVVATQHFIHPARTRRRGVRGWAVGRIQRWNERGVSRWIAISGVVGEEMLKRGDAESSRVSIVPNGMQASAREDTEQEAARRKLGLEVRDLVLVCPARLEEEKDHRTFLHACALLNAEGLQYRAFCVGEGSLRGELEAKVRELNLADRVFFPGYQTCVEDWIQAADAVVLASPEEPFGLVLLEAMSRGVAVVAADAGGPKEILEGGVGILFAPRDPRDLAQKILNLCMDSTERTRLGKAGYARWQSNFTRRKMVDAMVHVYESALRRGYD